VAVPGRPVVDGVKAPAATVFEDVIVVFVSFREARLSQFAAAADDAASPIIIRPVKNVRIALRIRFMRVSSNRLGYSWAL